MSTVKLNQPYKVLYHKIKRYTAHYDIPADNCVVVPIRHYGEDVACDVRWEDKNGELHHRERLFFTGDNIEPVRAEVNFELFELWRHYYQDVTKESNNDQAHEAATTAPVAEALNS